jgi:hypothetical protein
VLRLQGSGAPGLAQLNLGALRAGVTIVEVCDAADGRLDGVLTVGGAVATVEQQIAAVLAASDLSPELLERLEGLTLTIGLVETRSPDAEGGVNANRPVPRSTITLGDLGSGARVRVVYGVSGSPISVNANETPPAGDGTGGVN